MSLSSSADGGRSGHDSGVLQGDQQRKSYCVVKDGEQGSSQLSAEEQKRLLKS
jgi:hypothetical protein